jgi:hypothetical protein
MMLYRTLSWALREAGIAATPAQMNQLRAQLWNHIEDDGKPFVELL